MPLQTRIYLYDKERQAHECPRPARRDVVAAAGGRCGSLDPASVRRPAAGSGQPGLRRRRLRFPCDQGQGHADHFRLLGPSRPQAPNRVVHAALLPLADPPLRGPSAAHRGGRRGPFCGSGCARCRATPWAAGGQSSKCSSVNSPCISAAKSASTRSNCRRRDISLRAAAARTDTPPRRADCPPGAARSCRDGRIGAWASDRSRPPCPRPRLGRCTASRP